MLDRSSTGRTFESGAYWALLVVFNLFIIVSWMPRITTIGDSDIGIGALLLVVMVPLILVLPTRSVVDSSAWKLRLIILLALGFVIFWGYLGMYRLDNPLRAGRLLLSLGQGIILILVVSQLLSTRAISFSLGVCLCMLALSSILSLYGYLGGQPVELTYLDRDRSSGFFKNPNQYGIIASMAVPFAAAFYFQHQRKLLASFVLFAAATSLLLAASKTNIFIGLALLFAVMIVGFINARRAGFLLMIVPIMTLLIWVFGLPILEFFNPRAAAILTQLITSKSIEGSTVAQRYELWQYSLDVIRNFPLFGEGTGQPINVITQVLSHSHNVFLNLGRTTGIPGMVGGLVFILVACWLAIRTIVRVSAVPDAIGSRLHGRAFLIGAGFAVLSYVLSNQMSDSLGPSTSVFLWLSVGVLLRRHELVFSGFQQISNIGYSADNAERRVVSQRLSGPILQGSSR